MVQLRSMELTKDRELFLHRKSLILGRLFKNAYDNCGKEHPLTLELLERYKQARRELPGLGSFKGEHSTRYGAYDAYLVTQ